MRRKIVQFLISSNIFLTNNHLRSVCSFSKQDLMLNNYIIGNNNLNDQNFLQKLKANAEHRKDPPNIEDLKALWDNLQLPNNVNNLQLLRELQNHLFSLPNATCHEAAKLIKPLLLNEFGTKRIIADPLTLEKLSHHGVDMSCGHFSGSKSYFLRGSMARLEHNLIRQVEIIIFNFFFSLSL